MSAPRLNRKVHRLGAILVALPVLVIFGSGIFLQLKKDWTWVQPATLRGAATRPTISFDRVLEAARSVEHAAIASWDDIDRIDVRPDRGILKVHARNSWEVQVDTHTGEVLQVAYRRSDLIEDIHDGSFLHPNVKHWVFLPAAIVLLGLWGTGVYLWFLPHLVKWRRKHKR